jgi:hypothetical protein
MKPLLPWSRVLPEKLLVPQSVKNVSLFIEPRHPHSPPWISGKKLKREENQKLKLLLNVAPSIFQ